MTGGIAADTPLYITGEFHMSLPEAVCDSVTHLCIKYKDRAGAHPPTLDTDSSNDAVCTDISTMTMCTDGQSNKDQCLY